ncbi:protein of unknown function DUF433 [Rivularia sp. IAM M-261]|nr:protein of unknown function DUF433 [Rivularia sp. IAM M-261]
MDWQSRIIIDSNILVGKPIIKGTRLAVEFIIDLLAQGWTTDEILRNYPGIALEDIHACLSYASATLKAEKVYALPV